MPPWPDRADSRRPSLDLPLRIPRPNATVAPAPVPVPAPVPGRYTNNLTDFIPLDTAQLDASSSSSDGHLHPPRPTRPGHGRSMSNPFPSLFSGKKKKPGRAFAGQTYSGSSDEGIAEPNLPGQPQQARGGRHRASVSRDFTTGQCMTCGSLVRWPRELFVFRCTICLTINDLQPLLPEERNDNIQEGKMAPEDVSNLPPRPSNGKGNKSHWVA